MQVRWLGWAGVELEHDGRDDRDRPARRPGGDVRRASATPPTDIELPQVEPAAAGRAVAGLVSHLHRDHTDAGALAAALAPGAEVHHPVAAEEQPNLAVAQAEYELAPA